MRIYSCFVLVIAAVLSLLVVAGCAQKQDKFIHGPEAEKDLSQMTFDEGVDHVTSEIGKGFGKAVDSTGNALQAAWPFKPPKPIDADMLVLSRQHRPMALPEEVNEDRAQKISIDLDTGRMVLATPDGRRFPSQIEPKKVAKLKEHVDSRLWTEEEAYKPRRKDPATLNRWFYLMTVYVDGQKHEEQVIWYSPTTRDLPEPLPMIVEIFKEQERVAYPLSNQADLLTY